MSDELCLLPATELRARIVRKDVSPVEITRAVLARAERMQPELNCFITLCGNEAMAEARMRSVRSWPGGRCAFFTAFRSP